jgi:GntR family transcriptional regulator
VRELAARLRVNPNTVVKAYRELEHEAFIETRQGQGTFVVGGREASVRERERVVREALAHAAGLAVDSGLTPAQVRQMLEEALRALAGRGAASKEVPGDGN